MPSMSVSSEKIYRIKVRGLQRECSKMSGEYRTVRARDAPAVRHTPLLKTSDSLFPGSTIDQESGAADLETPPRRLTGVADDLYTYQVPWLWLYHREAFPLVVRVHLQDLLLAWGAQFLDDLDQLRVCHLALEKRLAKQ